jgi:hypothetical protein
MRMPVIGWLGRACVDATKWTGDATVEPETGEVTFTLQLVSAMQPIALSRNRFATNRCNFFNFFNSWGDFRAARKG